MVQDLSTKLAQTEETVVVYKEKLENVAFEAQTESANNFRKRKHYDEIINTLQEENKKLKEEKQDESSTSLSKPHTSPLLKKKDKGQVLRNISEEYCTLKVPGEIFYGSPSPNKKIEEASKTNQKSSVFEPSPTNYQKKIQKLCDDNVNENELMENHQEPLKKIKSYYRIPRLNMLNFITAPSKSTVYLPPPMHWCDFPSH